MSSRFATIDVQLTIASLTPSTYIKVKDFLLEHTTTSKKTVSNYTYQSLYHIMSHSERNNFRHIKCFTLMDGIKGNKSKLEFYLGHRHRFQNRNAMNEDSTMHWARTSNDYKQVHCS